MTVSRLCFEGNHEWCMNGSIAESQCTCSCHGARPKSERSNLQAKIEKLTVENNGLREFAEVANVKIAKLERAIETQRRAFVSGMDAAKQISSHQLATARKLHSEAKPEQLENERLANAVLTDEIERITDLWADRGIELLVAAKVQAQLRETIRIYGGHIPNCQGRPCTCGFQDAWRAAGLPESK